MMIRNKVMKLLLYIIKYSNKVVQYSLKPFLYPNQNIYTSQFGVSHNIIFLNS